MAFLGVQILSGDMGVSSWVPLCGFMNVSTKSVEQRSFHGFGRYAGKTPRSRQARRKRRNAAQHGTACARAPLHSDDGPDAKGASSAPGRQRAWKSRRLMLRVPRSPARKLPVHAVEGRVSCRRARTAQSEKTLFLQKNVPALRAGPFRSAVGSRHGFALPIPA